ncbi:indole-3-glycerol phosphate synthase [Natronobacterium gregoryi]|uniref:Indole-3-glycerol phosphate synthase n=2 Tax=Natronobacterium gregoryi TaxID=44930 RepID=L0ADT2_NATGS|nr:indole-3-glycerol phosphate synthase [Natronobacterium gregoryi]AFZ72006.1 Indole-3-glycerol phosphate synthase [Natronobacterium gregoryi SP2]ELY62718.1 indole-3-glycerol phosphate synthase [Natronobacterium gregoryi SP2]PLK20858.1 indole-3-glycerol-phosphate synthase [Natronobacterium gregoryi SP2]SFJ19865.1 indole-3-glycerol phosphate synthase [Natronobacterium gregoryi]
MNSRAALAPEVASILAAARERPGGDAPLEVEPRSLPDALERAEADGRVPVIAEVKPTSPTADSTREDDPVELAESMVAGGAAAISVLTEPSHFGGSPETLTRVREAVDVPVLRKDFVLREDQLDVVKADLMLVIARFVENLEELVAAARDRGFQPLVEVHDETELETALESGAEIIGVNNRDLARLEVDLETFESVSRAVPDDITLVAESGISTPANVRRMREAGADALLVGNAIMDHGATETAVEANTRRLTRATPEEET